jgi:hypothetical protein
MTRTSVLGMRDSTRADVRGRFVMKKWWIISGPTDADTEIPLFWSNYDGWVDLSNATVFSDRERNSGLRLPIRELRRISFGFSLNQTNGDCRSTHTMTVFEDVAPIQKPMRAPRQLLPLFVGVATPARAHLREVATNDIRLLKRRQPELHGRLCAQSSSPP